MTSTIKVNNIQNQCGQNIINENSNTITLGASGDTIALASGASQTGFGRTGTVDWQTGSIKTATFTATSGEGYFCNTAGGAFTVNLPAGSAGAIVSVQDYNNTFDSNDLTVTPNGSEKINGGAGSIVLNTEGEGLTLVYIDGTVGWRSIQDNDFSNVGSNYVTATGGTITTCGDYKIHSFTSPGTLSVTGAGAPAGSNTVEYMIVAGGGGGGAGRAGGGGGGGFRTCTAKPVSVQNYPITIGAGGAGGANDVQPGCGEDGNGGSATIALGVTSAGGGFGAGGDNASNPADPGGSGGGAGGNAPRTGGSGNVPSVSPPQGNNGGNNPSACAAAGGGGGAGGLGTTTSGSGSSSVAGPGGAGGTAVPIFGSSPKPFYGPTNGIYAGGGGGGASDGPAYGPGRTVGAGGTGGGGAGGKGNNSPAASAGLTNTGGGGGGGGHYGSGAPGPGYQGKAGGAGGSGIVLIRYKFQN